MAVSLAVVKVVSLLRHLHKILHGLWGCVYLKGGLVQLLAVFLSLFFSKLGIREKNTNGPKRWITGC